MDDTRPTRLASERGHVGKKTIKRIPTSRHVEFGDNSSIASVRKLLCSHSTQLRKGKRSEWSQSLQLQQQRGRDQKLEDIC